MSIRLVQADVLSVESDAIVIPIDGQARGLRGNVAHAFIRRWPEAYEDFEAHLVFPIVLGRVVQVTEDTEAPWRTILFASTLHHLETLTPYEKLDVVRAAMSGVLSTSVSSNLRSVSTVVLKGGWRLPLAAALEAMVGVYRGSVFHRDGRILNICCRLENDYAALKAECARRIHTGLFEVQ